MGQLKQIADGWWNMCFTTPENEKMAKERLEFCDNCFDEEGNPMIEYAVEKIKLYLHCKKCWCHAIALLHSEDHHCKLGKF